MAITQAMCTTFKEELFKAEHNFSSHTFKMALYTSSASLSAATTAFTTSGEVSGGSYSSGGVSLSNVSVSTSETTAFIDCDDVSFTGSTFTARGALIYNSSASNKAVAVLDFGEDKSPSSQTLTVTIPAAAATTALIRIE
jgi:hypothetical protein